MAGRGKRTLQPKLGAKVTGMFDARVQALSLQLHVAHARIADLERENAELRARVAAERHENGRTDVLELTII